MKKLKNIILTIFLIVICISGVAYADNTTSSDLQVTEKNSKSINSDLYLTGDSLEVNQNVEGNAFIIGKEVTVSSKIDGNLMIMANKVNLTENSYVDASIFIVANDIEFDTLSSHLYAVCNNLTISTNHGVYKDLYVLGNNVNIFGEVGRDAYVYANCLSLSGSNSVGKIKGNLTYSLPQNVDFPQGSIVGEKNFVKKFNTYVAPSFIDILFQFINAIFAVSLIYLILKFFMAKGLQKASSCLAHSFWKVFFIGLASLILIPIISILLIISNVASLIGLILIAIYVLMLVISPYILSSILGRRIANNAKQNKVLIEYLITIAVALVLSAVSIIPYIGFIVGLFISILGLGVIIYNLFFHKEPPKSYHE